jgi:Raf kinase inhibitor-like YbhB/YbcL family protein
VRKNQINRSIGTTFALILLGGSLFACSRDGRVLRESGPGQGESIAIVATTESSIAGSDTATSTFAVSGTWLASGTLDPRHTCFGSNISPALTLANVPAGTQSLAISLYETTNPDQPLWVVANIDPSTTVIQEGGTPSGAIVGAAFNGDKIMDGYSGPCVTDSELHEFVLTIYALGQMLEFEPETLSLSSSKLLLDAIRGAAFDSAESRFFVQNP